MDPQKSRHWRGAEYLGETCFCNNSFDNTWKQRKPTKPTNEIFRGPPWAHEHLSNEQWNLSWWSIFYLFFPPQTLLITATENENLCTWCSFTCCLQPTGGCGDSWWCDTNTPTWGCLWSVFNSQKMHLSCYDLCYSIFWRRHTFTVYSFTVLF